MDAVAVFPTTHLTLKAEKVFEREDIPYRTVMKPRRISSDCGLAIRISGDDVGRSRDAVLSAGLVPAAFFREADRGWELMFKLEKGAD